MMTNIGKYIVRRTDSRYRAHPRYQYIITAHDSVVSGYNVGYDFMAMHDLESWCRDMWGHPYWLNDNSVLGSEWNKHGNWAQEFNYRLKRSRVYLRSEDELLQFVVRWS
jgi:hypothetical protein